MLQAAGTLAAATAEACRNLRRSKGDLLLSDVPTSRSWGAPQHVVWSMLRATAWYLFSSSCRGQVCGIAQDCAGDTGYSRRSLKFTSTFAGTIAGLPSFSAG